MNQNERDLILYELENNKIDNKDLFLYDLTSYFDFANTKESIFNKIIEYKNIVAKMNHNPYISFTPSQKDIYNEILIPGKYAISATTSFGKTTLIKEYIFQLQPKIVVYIVPTNSLADELLEDFNKIYNNYRIIDTSLEKDYNSNEKIIFVGTQEKLNEIKWLKDCVIDLFVVDEAYKLSDEINGYREIALNRAFVDYVYISKTCILLLPLVDDIIGLEQFGVKILKCDYSPVAKKYVSINDEIYDEVIINKVHINQEKNLVYFDSPNELEKFYWENLYDVNCDCICNDNWVKRLENDFHPDWLPINAYKKGICIHHGSIPKFIQIKMVKMFNSDKNFNTLLSTSSLIEGVNTPTKNIFIKDKKILSKKNQIKFKNLIGRAGRLNITPVGYIYYSDKNTKDFEIANENWKNIKIKFILNNDKNIEEINRAETSEKLIELSNKYNINDEELKEFLETAGINLSFFEKFINKIQNYNEFFKNHEWALNNTPGLVQLYQMCHFGKNGLFGLNVNIKSGEEISKILNATKPNIYNDILYDYFRKLFSATINQVVNGYNLTSIKGMVNYIIENIDFKLYNMNISMVVSSVIKMIYNFLPYELMPLLENIINLNLLFKKNGQELLNDIAINKINNQIAKYNIKYYGTTECSEKNKKIIKRLFEYGIPFNIIKNDIEYISNNLGQNFSILDIKHIINKNENLKYKLEKYFE